MPRLGSSQGAEVAMTPEESELCDLQIDDSCLRSCGCGSQSKLPRAGDPHFLSLARYPSFPVPDASPGTGTLEGAICCHSFQSEATKENSGPFISL